MQRAETINKKVGTSGVFKSKIEAAVVSESCNVTFYAPKYRKLVKAMFVAKETRS